jgi:hypothetical protein
MGKKKGGEGGKVVKIEYVDGLGKKNDCKVYDGKKLFVVG